MAHYDLGELWNARRIERGFVNENWDLETIRGRYFLKRRHPDLRNPGVIGAQHALVEHLRQAGFPAPTILHTTGGATFLVFGEESYEIQEYIEGTPYDHTNAAHFQEAASTLALYHILVRDFSPPALHDRGGLYDPTILSTNLAKLTKAWQLEQDSGLSPLLRQLVTHAADLATRYAGQESLPHLVIHGDYYADNLLFEGDHVVGVVDYDKACWQPRVAELAEALIYFASPRPGHLRHLVYPGFLDWEPFTRFLRHYARANPLDESEVHALPDYIRCIWLLISLQRLIEGDRRPAEAAGALHEVLALGNWAADHVHQMVEISRAATGIRASPESLEGADMIKAIIFDFGRVISAQKPSSLFRSYEQDLGLEPGTINPIMFGSQAWEDALLGLKTAKEFWYAIGPELGLHAPEEIEAFRHRYHADEAINEGVRHLIQRLRQRDHYKLAVLSNSPPDLAQWLDDWQMLDLFDVVFCSGDEGVVKPDPTAFEITLGRLGVAPEEAVFIDDSLGHVETARRLGLHGILFTTAEELADQLHDLLDF